MEEYMEMKQDMMADEFMSAYEKGGEPALAKAMGISDQELDQEIAEYSMEHGLHADDDRDDIIQGVMEDYLEYEELMAYDSLTPDAPEEPYDESYEDITHGY